MRFIFKTRYGQDIDLFKHNGQRFWYGLLAIVALLAPLSLDSFYVGELALVFIYAIAGIGLMLLVGYTGLVSLGHADEQYRRLPAFSSRPCLWSNR